MLENSLKSSVYFDLGRDSLYDVDHESLAELETRKPQLESKAVLQNFVGFLIFCDFSFLMAAFAFSPVPFSLFLKIPSTLGSLVVGVFLTMLSLVIFYVSKLYRIETIANYRFFCARFSVILLSVLAVGEIEKFMISPHASALAVSDHPIIMWSCVTLCLFLALRYAAAEAFRFFAARGYVSHNVAVIGTSELAADCIVKLHASGLGVRVRAVFEDNLSISRPLAVADVPVKGGIPALLHYTKHHPVDTVIIASASHAAFDLVKQLSCQPLRIAALRPRLISSARSTEVPFAWCAPAGTLPGVNLLQLADVPIRGLGSLMKTAVDVTVALSALLLFGPLMLICAAGIKLSSPGPVFFKQRRIGYRNKEFFIYKFRTMHLADCHTSVLTVRNDPRIFKFGEIMRSFSLDELPQLLNVLKGDMSLVGPRPHIQEARAAGILYYNAVANYAARHRVKPGITGHAQISGWRGPTETIEQIENRVAHDLYYVENWSLMGDIKILFKTIFVGFFGENAF